ncbi:hypothetical protein GCM10023350_52730 [Nocardioides endophyticus]|uniref:Uncharacterized protein n=1 Tax=Nocardioides endophyticus TaxID=1353775 RepID=A0ABP8ZMI8_9ACTN
MLTPIRLATATVMLMLLTACGNVAGETSPSAGPSAPSSVATDRLARDTGADVGTEKESSPWAVHYINGWEVESYGSLASLVRSADLVALGTVVAVKPGPTWVESEGDETMTSEITAYTVELTDVLSGKPVGSTPGRITLEFGPNSPDAVEGRTAVVGESSLFILRRKGAPIPSIGRLEPMKQDFAREVYRVVNSMGVIADVDGAAALPLGDPDQAWAEELERGSFAEALEHVRAAVVS